MNEKVRPSPEQLLQQANEEEKNEAHGKLKIYLGAAPGVGKTYEMLRDALEERSKELDIVVGVAESHGRKEIEAMLKKFEILPRQIIEYRGQTLSEFDLDAALKRYPALMLMDEMAHTNAPNTRHKKRWQDIKELLDRGIDVYTTLNVQHIESLTDDIAQIIHAPILETVPDSMIDEADTIELVDLPPQELLDRLREGKVYIPQQVDLATEHFFRKGNLTALRELALRTTAKCVGAQVLLYRHGEGIQHIWPTKDKILVCVGPEPESLKLIRAARRIASSLQAEWLAVYVDTPKLQVAQNRRNNAIKNLRLAEQLGAETHVLVGSDIVTTIMNFAHEKNVTQVMIWKHIRTRWRDWFHRNLSDEMVRQSGEIDIYIMTGESEKSKPRKKMSEPYPIPWRSYLISSGLVAAATLINFLLYPILSTSNLIMVYLLAITLASLLGQIGPAVFASLLAVLCYGFFFISPFYSFTISDFKDLITLAVMLVISQVISHLTILNRRQTEAARLIQQRTEALYTFSRKLAKTRGIKNLLDIGLRQLNEIFDSEVLALLPKNGSLMSYSLNNEHPELGEKELSVAQWVFDLGQMAGYSTDTLAFSDALYFPLLGSQGSVGVLRIRPRVKQLFTPEQMRLLGACANQLALALEVDRLHVQGK